MKIEKIETEAVITISLTSREANVVSSYLSDADKRMPTSAPNEISVLQNIFGSALYAIKNKPPETNPGA